MSNIRKKREKKSDFDKKIKKLEEKTKVDTGENGGTINFKKNINDVIHMSFTNRLKFILATFRAFIIEFFFMRQKNGSYKPNATKVIATIFCTISAWGFILKFHGSEHVTSTDLAILSGLATSMIGLYQLSKNIRLKNEEDNQDDSDSENNGILSQFFNDSNHP